MLRHLLSYAVIGLAVLCCSSADAQASRIHRRQIGAPNRPLDFTYDVWQYQWVGFTPVLTRVGGYPQNRVTGNFTTTYLGQTIYGGKEVALPGLPPYFPSWGLEFGQWVVQDPNTGAWVPYTVEYAIP